MRKFIIQRDLPGVGQLGKPELRDASAKSNAVLAELGTDVQWVHSYVTADKLYCIYLATDEALIHRHAELSGFPANVVTEVHRIIDPTTAGALARSR